MNRVSCLMAVALAALATFASAITADDILSLKLRSPLPTAGNLEVAMSLEGDRFLVAGAKGALALSEDAGVSWSPVGGTSASWTYGATSGDLHVIIGVSAWGVSTDGKTWKTGSFDSHFLPFGMVYGNGRFVATGTNGSIRVSEDGESWTSVSLPSEWNTLVGLTYDDSRFVGVAIDKVLVSSNGEQWSLLGTLPTDEIRDLSYASEVYCASGRNGLLYTSSDALTWTLREPNVVYPIEVVYGFHGRFYVAGFGGRYVMTEDFQNYEIGGTGVSGKSPIAVDAVSGVLVACGNSGAISRSEDGIAWTDQRQIVGKTFESVAYGNGVFVTVDDTSGLVYHSSDGLKWEQAEIEVPGLFRSDIVFYRSHFRILGNFGVMASPDGRAWATSEGPENVGLLERLSVVNDRLLGVSPNGSLFESVDGEAWTEHVVSTEDRLEYVTFGNGLYVVVGNGSAIYTSPNLETWTARPLAADAQMKRVHFDGTHFYTFDLQGKANLVSTDGIEWEIPEGMPRIYGRGAMWDSELGIYFVGSGFLQWHSPEADPIEWESSAFSNRLEVAQLAVGDDGTIVAVGREGLVMSRGPIGGGYTDWVSAYFPESDSASAIEADPDGDGQSNLEEYVAGTEPNKVNVSMSTMEITEDEATLSWNQVESAEGVGVRMEVSDDLDSWETLEGVVIDDRSQTHSANVSISSSKAQRYYRLRWELE